MPPKAPPPKAAKSPSPGPGQKTKLPPSAGKAPAPKGPVTPKKAPPGGGTASPTKQPSKAPGVKSASPGSKVAVKAPPGKAAPASPTKATPSKKLPASSPTKAAPSKGGAPPSPSKKVPAGKTTPGKAAPASPSKATPSKKLPSGSPTKAAPGKGGVPPPPSKKLPPGKSTPGKAPSAATPGKTAPTKAPPPPAPATSTPSEPPSSAGSKESPELEAFRQRLVRYFTAREPSKLPTVDKVVQQFGTRQEECFQKLTRKYGPEPESPARSPTAGGPPKKTVPAPGKSSAPPPKPAGESATPSVSLSPATSSQPTTPARPEPESFEKQQEPVKQERPASAAAPVKPPGHPSSHNDSTEEFSPEYVNRLTVFYERYEPSKLGQVHKVLRTYRGREEELFKRLAEKYGPEPAPAPEPQSSPTRGTVETVAPTVAEAEVEALPPEELDPVTGLMFATASRKLRPAFNYCDDRAVYCLVEVQQCLANGTESSCVAVLTADAICFASYDGTLVRRVALPHMDECKVGSTFVTLKLSSAESSDIALVGPYAKKLGYTIRQLCSAIGSHTRFEKVSSSSPNLASLRLPAHLNDGIGEGADSMIPSRRRVAELLQRKGKDPMDTVPTAHPQLGEALSEVPETPGSQPASSHKIADDSDDGSPSYHLEPSIARNDEAASADDGPSPPLPCVALSKEIMSAHPPLVGAGVIWAERAAITLSSVRVGGVAPTAGAAFLTETHMYLASSGVVRCCGLNEVEKALLRAVGQAVPGGASDRSAPARRRAHILLNCRPPQPDMLFELSDEAAAREFLSRLLLAATKSYRQHKIELGALEVETMQAARIEPPQGYQLQVEPLPPHPTRPDYVSRLKAFYERHDSSKISEAESTLIHFHGHEEMLFDDLVRRYGTEPAIPVPSQQEPSDQPRASLSVEASWEGKPFRERLIAYCTARCPDNLVKVDAVLAHYKGHEAELLEQLTAKYGPEIPFAGGIGVGARARVPATMSHRERLVAFCTVRCPERLEKVDQVLSVYRHREEELFALMVSMYGPEPDYGGPQPEKGNVVTDGEAAAKDYYGMSATRARLVRFYEKYAPHKVDDCETALQRYHGREEELFAELVKKYGPEPPANEPVKQPQDDHKARLLRFYEKYAPQKVSSCDAALQRYEGREEELFRDLVKKYGPEPEPPKPALSRVSMTKAPPQPTPPAASNLWSDACRARLMRFFAHYDPPRSTAAVIEETLKRFSGSEEELFAQLFEEYGPEPLAQDTIGSPTRDVYQTLDPTTELPYATFKEGDRPLFPDIWDTAALHFIGRVLHWEPPALPLRRFLLLSKRHVYVADNEDTFFRCTPLSSIRGVFINSRRRDPDSQCSVLLKVYPAEHDIFVTFPSDFEAKRFVWAILEVHSRYNFTNSLKASAVASISDAAIDPRCERHAAFKLQLAPIPVRDDAPPKSDAPATGVASPLILSGSAGADRQERSRKTFGSVPQRRLQPAAAEARVGMDAEDSLRFEEHNAGFLQGLNPIQAQQRAKHSADGTFGRKSTRRNGPGGAAAFAEVDEDGTVGTAVMPSESAKKRLTEFLQEHDPAELANVNQLVEQFAGREDDLFAYMAELYDVPRHSTPSGREQDTIVAEERIRRAHTSSAAALMGVQAVTESANAPVLGTSAFYHADKHQSERSVVTPIQPPARRRTSYLPDSAATPMSVSVLPQEMATPAVPVALGSSMASEEVGLGVVVQPPEEKQEQRMLEGSRQYSSPFTDPRPTPSATAEVIDPSHETAPSASIIQPAIVFEDASREELQVSPAPVVVEDDSYEPEPENPIVDVPRADGMAFWSTIAAARGHEEKKTPSPPIRRNPFEAMQLQRSTPASRTPSAMPATVGGLMATSQPTEGPPGMADAINQQLAVLRMAQTERDEQLRVRMARIDPDLDLTIPVVPLDASPVGRKPNDDVSSLRSVLNPGPEAVPPRNVLTSERLMGMSSSRQSGSHRDANASAAWVEMGQLPDIRPLASSLHDPAEQRVPRAIERDRTNLPIRVEDLTTPEVRDVLLRIGLGHHRDGFRGVDGRALVSYGTAQLSQRMGNDTQAVHTMQHWIAARIRMARQVELDREKYL